MTSNEGHSRAANEVPQREPIIAVLATAPLQRSRVAISSRDTFLVVTVAFLRALCYPLIKTSLAVAPPLRFFILRAALVGLVLLAISQTTNRAMPKDRRTWAYIAGTGFGATTIGFGGMFLAGVRWSQDSFTVAGF